MEYRSIKFSFQDAFLGWGGLSIFFLALLILIGVAFIHSASCPYNPQDKAKSYAVKQVFWLGIAFICFCIGILIDYRWVIKNSFWFYLLGILFLIATFFLGKTVNGSKRWINLGFALLQTSEIMKLAIIPTLAKILTLYPPRGNFSDLIIPFTFTTIPMILIVLQPDLGTSLVFFPIVFAMCFAAGVRLKHLVLVVFMMFILAVLAYSFVLHDYQKKRVETFLYQDSLTQEQIRDSGYHLIQSKIAMGNGYILGKGWMKGTQNRLGFLPEDHTDFIYAVIGEEWGLVGTTLVLILYFLLFFCMFMLAYTALMPEGQLTIIGIIALMLTQVFVNTCMTVGMAPITGLPLPFVSYGGSSLLFNFSGIALVISIAGHNSCPY